MNGVPQRIEDETTDPEPMKPRRAKDDAIAGLPVVVLAIALLLLVVTGLARAGGH